MSGTRHLGRDSLFGALARREGGRLLCRLHRPHLSSCDETVYERLMGNGGGSSFAIVAEATAIIAAGRRFGGNVAGVIKADCRYHSWQP